METTLIILKPDAVQRGLMGRIISRFEDKGLQNDGLVGFMTSSPVLVLAIRGKSAIAVCRKMMGATFGSNAEAGTIRGDFGVSNSFNLIHGSDSPEAAEKELGLFFNDGEVLSFTRPGDVWVYDMSGGTAE